MCVDYCSQCASFPPPHPTSPLHCRLPLLLQPYLHSMHNSPVKCQAVYSDVRTDIWQLIDKAGSLQNSVTHPARIKVSTRTYTHTHTRTHTHGHPCTRTHAHTLYCGAMFFCRSGPLMEAMWRLMPHAVEGTSLSQVMKMEPSSSGTSHTVSLSQLPACSPTT